ncbi:hypothetical protein AV274_2718 [Blastocystis sp. ATCC 50177/Nand II]|uniref:Uncharacterized protein n=1 Tax=Blastocystis sp. subtype 1 (strain ATCC 50177 / NandII) TaxID=478820 RepID=A0A196SI65_BLAHN|nr:hypothetical protein AV274_2718 [Blastocystis sp. ATCC 50177/Nand II]
MRDCVEIRCPNKAILEKLRRGKLEETEKNNLQNKHYAMARDTVVIECDVNDKTFIGKWSHAGYPSLYKDDKYFVRRMKETAKDGIPTRDTAKNPLMKELVETSPEIPPAVTRQREERAEYVQTIVDCGKKLKQQMTGEKQEKKDEGRVDSGITVAIDILQLQRNQVLHYNLRRKRRICRLLHDIQMEISVAVHEVSRDQELDEEMLQFEEEQQQLQEVQGDTSV